MFVVCRLWLLVCCLCVVSLFQLLFAGRCVWNLVCLIVVVFVCCLLFVVFSVLFAVCCLFWCF